MAEEGNRGSAITTNDDGNQKWIVAAMNSNLLTTTATTTTTTTTTSMPSNCDTTSTCQFNMVGKTLGRIIFLKDPGTGDYRDYIIMTTTTNNSVDNKQECQYLIEIQDLPSDYSAFLVGRHIVKDGNLYLLSRIDPLFFFVASQEHHLLQSQTIKKSWQPMEQCLEELDVHSKQPLLPRDIHPVITQEQLLNVCLSFENDNVTYLRFDVNKTLKWLQRKHERLWQCLIRQDQYEQQQQRQANSVNHLKNGNNDDDYFYMPVEDETNHPTTPSQVGHNQNDSSSTTTNNNNDSPLVVLSDTQALKIQSLQILCNYLTKAWAQKLVDYLGFSMDQIYPHKQRHNQINKSQASNNDSPNNMVTSVAVASDIGYTIQRVIEEGVISDAVMEKKELLRKQTESLPTLAHKRLAKVNTKGMKSITSFFSVPPAKKKVKK
jgi:hypothetical protein